MPISIFSRWVLASVGMVFALIGGWGVMSYLEQQQREVVVPGKLLEHLENVKRGLVNLEAEYVFAGTLRQQQEAVIHSQLLQDLKQSGHPDPIGASGLLLPKAARYLQGNEGLARSLTQRLQALPQSWTLVDKQADHWRVRAGDECLVLAYQSESPKVLWQWMSIDGCSVGSG